jgi:hypothetical protein
MNYDPSQLETGELRQCEVCQAWPRECDKFCRRCGSRLGASGEIQSVGMATSARTTSRLSQDVYHRVSGPLVAVVTTNISNHTAPLSNRFVKQLISALMSIPIWLIIVLLSPLDAYATVKTISKGI